MSQVTIVVNLPDETDADEAFFKFIGVLAPVLDELGGGGLYAFGKNLTLTVRPTEKTTQDETS